jgi:hypothetical protein
MPSSNYRSVVSALGIACVAWLGGCALDDVGTGPGSRADSGKFADAAIDGSQGDGSTDSGGTAGTGGKPKPDAATRDDRDASEAGAKSDAASTTDKDSGDGLDAGVDAGFDAYVPPPPPPPTRLLPHLAGGSVGRSFNYKLYHSVGAPRVTGASVPRGASSSAHYRLTSGLSAAAP